MASKRRLRRQACLGKKRYLDGGEAEQNARYVRGRFGASVYPYKCPHCQGWHIGHPQQLAPNAERKSRRASGDKYAGPSYRDH